MAQLLGLSTPSGRWIASGHVSKGRREPASGDCSRVESVFFFEKRGAFWFEVVRLRFGSAVGLQGMGLVLDGQLGLVRLAGDGLIGNLG